MGLLESRLFHSRRKHPSTDRLQRSRRSVVVVVCGGGSLIAIPYYVIQPRGYWAQSARIGSSAIIGSNPIEPPIFSHTDPTDKRRHLSNLTVALIFPITYAFPDKRMN